MSDPATQNTQQQPAPERAAGTPLSQPPEPTPAPVPEPSKAKWRTFNALENLPAATGAARIFGIALLLLIVANAFLVGVGTSRYYSGGFDLLFVFNVVSTCLFTIEYILRLWIADLVYPNLTPGKARLRYAVSPMGLIDLLSFVPMIFLWATPYSAAIADAVRIIRLVRLIKISRYMRGLKTIGKVFLKSEREIVASFMVVALLCIASSVLMYEAEHAVQPEKFDSVFTGMYWAMTTMTTTGYGDLVPITPLGRLIGFVTMVLSIGVVAIPAGIFAAGFVDEFNSRNTRNYDERPRDERGEQDEE